jgi:hypothetical protein
MLIYTRRNDHPVDVCTPPESLVQEVEQHNAALLEKSEHQLQQ